MLFGIDLGGTKTEGVALSRPDSDAIIARHRVPTSSANGYEAILETIRSLIDHLAQVAEERPTSIGIGTPGTLDPLTQTLKNSNTQCLNGKPLKRDLEAMLKIPVAMENDANCFALAEATFGAAKGAASCFGVIMGTGVGGGVVIDGKVLHGAQGIAGEWGHNVLDPSGPACYCGKSGCVETLLSGTGLENLYVRKGGQPLKLPEIVKRAEDPNIIDNAARETLSFLIDGFGRAIAVVINILDPEYVVLGGGVSGVKAFVDAAQNAPRPYVFNNRLDTKIVPNKLGDSAGVFGAACLVNVLKENIPPSRSPDPA